MPELGPHDRPQGDAVEDAERIGGRPVLQAIAQPEHPIGVEIAGTLQRLAAQQLPKTIFPVAKKRRDRRRAERRLLAEGNVLREKVGGGDPEEVLLPPQPPELLPRVQLRAESDEVFVQKRIAGLDRTCQRNMIGPMQETRELDLVADVQRLIQRMPAPHPFEVERDLVERRFALHFGQHVVAQQPPVRGAGQVIERRAGVEASQLPVDAAKFFPGRAGKRPVEQPFHSQVDRPERAAPGQAEQFMGPEPDVTGERFVRSLAGQYDLAARGTDCPRELEDRARIRIDRRAIVGQRRLRIECRQRPGVADDRMVPAPQIACESAGNFGFVEVRALEPRGECRQSAAICARVSRQTGRLPYRSMIPVMPHMFYPGRSPGGVARHRTRGLTPPGPPARWLLRTQSGRCPRAVDSFCEFNHLELAATLFERERRHHLDPE